MIYVYTLAVSTFHTFTIHIFTMGINSLYHMAYVRWREQQCQSLHLVVVTLSGVLISTLTFLINCPCRPRKFTTKITKIDVVLHTHTHTQKNKMEKIKKSILIFKNIDGTCSHFNLYHLAALGDGFTPCAIHGQIAKIVSCMVGM